MSRFRKALAAAAMAVAAAGGGLLVTGAGAAPANAATQMPSLGGHAGAHVVATITFRRAATPASGSPNVILPCAVHSPGPAATAGAAPADDTCDSGVITCDVTASNPYYNSNTRGLVFFAKTQCSDDVTQIRMGQDVIHSTPIDPNNPLTATDITNGIDIATTLNEAACQPGQYAVNASARIVPPDGYVVQGSLHDTSATITFTASDCPSSGGGGGGGGGCATATPPASAQPATRRPDLIVCP